MSETESAKTCRDARGGVGGGGGATPSGLALLEQALLDALAARQRDERLGALADDKDVLQSRGERVAGGVLDVDDVERALVLLDELDDADATQVATADDHAEMTDAKLDDLGDLARFDVDLDRVVDLDQRVRVANRARVVRDDVRHALGADELVAHAAQLELGLGRQNLVHRKAALDVVQQAVVFVRFGDRDDVCSARAEQSAR